MPSPASSIHPAALNEEALMAEVQCQTGRRGGPGGQHRNKVETAVRLTHPPTGLSAEASERRSQSENRRQAIFRLRLVLALSVRCEPMKKQPPSGLWQSRCRGGKLSINPTHRDYPTLLAEALDRLAVGQWDASATAKSLGCSTSQLLKLLRHEPRAFELLNRQRVSLGERRYKSS